MSKKKKTIKEKIERCVKEIYKQHREIEAHQTAIIHRCNEIEMILHPVSDKEAEEMWKKLEKELNNT